MHRKISGILNVSIARFFSSTAPYKGYDSITNNVHSKHISFSSAAPGSYITRKQHLPIFDSNLFLKFSCIFSLLQCLTYPSTHLNQNCLLRHDDQNLINALYQYYLKLPLKPITMPGRAKLDLYCAIPRLIRTGFMLPSQTIKVHINLSQTN